MKKIFSFIAVVFMMICCAVPVNAETFQHIKDDSGNLTDMELNRLDEILSAASEKTGFNLYADITENDDFSEYENKFHSGNDNDKIEIVVSKSSDKTEIYIAGIAQQYINDDKKSEMLSRKSENASEKIENFADDVVNITAQINAQQSVVTSEPVRKKTTEKTNHNSTLFIIVSGIIGGAVVGIFTGLYLRFLYRRTENEFAVSNYRCTHKTEFEVKEDKFKREFINKSDTSS